MSKFLLGKSGKTERLVVDVEERFVLGRSTLGIAPEGKVRRRVKKIRMKPRMMTLSL